MDTQNIELLRKRNGAVITTKEYETYSNLCHSAITRRIREKRDLPCIGNISRLGRIYMLTVNVSESSETTTVKK